VTGTAQDSSGASDTRKKDGTIPVSSGLHIQSRFFAASRPLWRWLGDVESRVLAEEVRDIEISRPVYVCSLARAGTTIVTELLESHAQLTSHHYSDFPNVWTPYWRNHLLRQTRRKPPIMVERAHGDRILVSNDSPEAVEEILWMAFFDGLHDPAEPNTLDGSKLNEEFNRFYTDHIRKLLCVRQKPRYLAKGNYNLSRLGYILSLFADARFVIPIRDPETHIASMVKQQERFTRANELDRRIGLQLSLAGHFEFGPHRTCINFGNGDSTAEILADWKSGREIQGWAKYWASTYEYLAEQLSRSPQLARACLLFRYEDLCTKSEPTIDEITNHCELAGEGFRETRAEFVDKLSLPDYYETSFSDEYSGLIKQLCGPALEGLNPFLSK
jgi:hypothetical protein